MRTIILAIWALLAPGADRYTDAGRIADAIVAVVGGDEHVASRMAVYAWKESNLRPLVVGDGGRSCGVWQMSCSRVAQLSVQEQAALWLRDVRASSLAAVDSSAKRAALRTRLAEELLARAHQSMDSSGAP